MKLLSEFGYRTQDGRWKFFLKQRYKVDLGLGLKGYHRFYSRGKLIATLRDDILLIYEGYSWDGCSPSLSFLSIRLGILSPEQTLIASLIHDVLYQFLRVRCCPWTRAQADQIFLLILTDKKHKLKDIYYLFVRYLGGIVIKISSPGNIYCEEHPINTGTSAGVDAQKNMGTNQVEGASLPGSLLPPDDK